MSHSVHAPFEVRRPTLVDALAAMAVFLQVTELYRPLGLILGFPTSQLVNVAFGVVFAIYLGIRHRVLFRMLGSKTIAAWVFVLLPAPALIMCLQFLGGSIGADELVYWSAFSALYVSLLLVVAILRVRCGDRFVGPFFVACIVATWFGFLVNAANYPFIREVLAFTSNRIAVSESATRIMGFYPHPNNAAFALCLFLACAVTVERFHSQSVICRSLLIVGSLVGVLVTGSRTSLILMLCVLLFLVILGNRSKSGASRRVVAAAGSIAVVLFVSAIAVGLLMTLDPELAAFLQVRIGSFSDIATGQIGARDDSAGLRLLALKEYFSDIAAKPLLGYGPEYAFQQISSGYFPNVSQNSWVEWALKFGVFYPVAVFTIFCFTFRRACWIGEARSVVRQRAQVLFLLLFLGMLSLVDVFWLRCAMGALGLLLGQMFLGRGQRVAAGSHVAADCALAQSGLRR